MGKRLQTVSEHVTDITISTATVDIQVMRIGTKQMTLAVFRQLPSKAIIDECGNLLAPPWGWVNYDIVGCKQPLVFSYHGVLYRDMIDLEALEKLIVKPEIQGKIPTGGWLIVSSGGHAWRGSYYIDDTYLLFQSEAGARKHFANRQISLATLKDAPQLFIGV